MNRRAYAITFLFLLAGLIPRAHADINPGEAEENASVEERTGAQVDLQTPFTDENGKEVKLKDLMLPNRPALLIPVYYNCPYICSITLVGTSKVINEAGLEPGKDYSVITFSFNDREDSRTAESAAKRFRAALKDDVSKDAWHFLTGKKDSIDRLTREIGFHYQLENGEYVHAAMFVFLTPEGKISRYAYGVSLEPENFRYSLIEASDRKVGNALDKIFLYCFHYDDASGRYTPLIWNITRIFSVVVLGAVVLMIVLLRQRRV